MTPPRVAVTMRTGVHGPHREPRDALSQDWTRFLEGIGAVPVPVPNVLSDPATYLDGIAPDALLLSNGGSLGEAGPRDEAEATLLDAARARDLPILGVCRGFQFLADAFGGTVTRGFDADDASVGHAGTTHEVEVGGPFTDVLPEVHEVNSYHDDAVLASDAPPDLRVFARSPRDDVVEGLVHPREPLLAIQWHPERPLPDPDPTTALVRRFLTEGRTW